MEPAAARFEGESGSISWELLLVLLCGGEGFLVPLDRDDTKEENAVVFEENVRIAGLQGQMNKTKISTKR
jgi:hypothetical protein